MLPLRPLLLVLLPAPLFILAANTSVPHGVHTHIRTTPAALAGSVCCLVSPTRTRSRPQVLLTRAASAIFLKLFK